MADDADRLVHLAGYSTLAVVLASANWSGLGATLFVLPVVLGTLAYAGWLGYGLVLSRARGELEESRELAGDGAGPERRGRPRGRRAQ